jgi:hypothetical protein
MVIAKMETNPNAYGKTHNCFASGIAGVAKK